MYIVLLNCSSGSDKASRFKEDIKQAFEEAGQQARLVALKPGKGMREEAEARILEAKERGEIVIAAGGDGTVNLVAGLCHQHEVPLGIIPHGTFNYFAREHLVPLTVPEAVEAILKGETKEVSVGLVNDTVFLNNASFGIYTKLIRDREKASLRFGRIRLVAVIAALYSLFGKQRHMPVKINARGKETSHITPLVFVGNNTLQLENLGLEGASFTRENKLALIIMRRSNRWHIARFFLRGIAKSLSRDTNLHEFGAAGFEIVTPQKSIELVLDGEILRYESPLRFRADERALKILAPREETK